MDVIIDRFEGGFAVVELPDGGMCDMPLPLVPKDAKEGSVITIGVNREETEIRTKNAENRLKGLFKSAGDKTVR